LHFDQFKQAKRGDSKAIFGKVICAQLEMVFSIPLFSLRVAAQG